LELAVAAAAEDDMSYGDEPEEDEEEGEEEGEGDEEGEGGGADEFEPKNDEKKDDKPKVEVAR
jgi:hypothetical protein